MGRDHAVSSSVRRSGRAPSEGVWVAITRVALRCSGQHRQLVVFGYVQDWSGGTIGLVPVDTSWTGGPGTHSARLARCGVSVGRFMRGAIAATAVPPDLVYGIRMHGRMIVGLYKEAT